MNNCEFGKIGEDIATNFLINNNYKILERNFRSNYGEIDIIGKDNTTIVFFEVKTRKDVRFGRGVEAVNGIKQKHIKSVAKFYLYKNRINNYDIRFDVIEIYINNKKVWINQIKNAF